MAGDRAQMSIDEYGGYVGVHGRGNSYSRAQMGVNEYGNGAVSTWDKNSLSVGNSEVRGNQMRNRLNALLLSVADPSGIDTQSRRCCSIRFGRPGVHQGIVRERGRLPPVRFCSQGRRFGRYRRDKD